MSLRDQVVALVIERARKTTATTLAGALSDYTRQQIVKALRTAKAAGLIALVSPGESRGSEFTEAAYGPLPKKPPRRITDPKLLATMKLAQQRREVAIDMRQRGKSYGQIAMRLSISTTRAKEYGRSTC